MIPFDSFSNVPITSKETCHYRVLDEVQRLEDKSVSRIQPSTNVSLITASQMHFVFNYLE